MRLTHSRKLVLDIFQNDNALLCAEDINKKLSGEAIDLSTIYRTLEYFTNKDILGKSTIDKVTYYYLKEGDHHHYMICTDCLVRLPIECEIDKMLRKNIKQYKFEVTSHDLTIYGYCTDCAKNHKEHRKSHG